MTTLEIIPGMTKLSSVSVKKYPKKILPQNIAFRCYKSAPTTATIQLRSSSSYTTAAYVDADQLRKIISDLQSVLSEIV